MIDLTGAPEQKEWSRGPVPAGSIVMVTISVLMPDPARQAGDNPYISVARSGLRQIYCDFYVNRGSFEGVHFRQNITLPPGMQTIALTPNFERACNIGWAQLKAICLAAGRQPKLNTLHELNGLMFPVKVKINDRPNEYNGTTFWNNEIALIVTPDKPEFQTVRANGEIINAHGAVTGKTQGASDAFGGSQYANGGNLDAMTNRFFDQQQQPAAVDEVPF